MQKPVQGFVRHAKDVEQIKMEGGAMIRWLITHRDGAQNFSLRVIEVGKGNSTPYHVHDYEHEIFVIKGKVEVTIGEGKHRAEEDDFIYIPPNAYHGMLALDELKILCVVPIKAAKSVLGP